LAAGFVQLSWIFERKAGTIGCSRTAVRDWSIPVSPKAWWKKQHFALEGIHREVRRVVDEALHGAAARGGKAAVDLRRSHTAQICAEQ